MDKHTRPHKTDVFIDDGIPCDICGDDTPCKPKLGVQRSAAGYYIGYAYSNCCVPYSRESGYYPTYDGASDILTSLVGEILDFANRGEKR